MTSSFETASSTITPHRVPGPGRIRYGKPQCEGMVRSVEPGQQENHRMGGAVEKYRVPHIRAAIFTSKTVGDADMLKWG